MSTINGKKVVLTAGGSGGHVFPAEALARELQANGIEVSFITDRRGNSFSGRFPHLKEYRVFAGAYAGKPFLKKVWAFILMGLGFLQSLLILRKLKPQAVVGFGGYASFPASLAAICLKIPLILHEQNSVLGGANRVLARYARLIATTFPSVEGLPEKVKTVHTGLPVRPEISALRDQPYLIAQTKFRLLVFGGSQGANIFSRIIPEALKNLPLEIKKRLQITQQCREQDLPFVQKAYEGSGLDVTLSSFFPDIDKHLAQAQLVICRAGASSIAELSIAGRPALIVPILHSADSHQLKNALFISQVEGAFLCKETEFSCDNLNKKIQELIANPQILAYTAQKAKEFGKPDAVHLLASAVIETI